MRKNTALRILPFVTTIAIMLAIFMFSAQPAEQSSAVSRGLTAKIVDFLPFVKHFSAEDKLAVVSKLHNFIRKCAHFSIYCMLGISSSGMFLSINDKMPVKRMLIYSIVFCCIYASTDEFHQLFVSGRGGMVSDVVLDTCGSAVGGGVFTVIRILLKKRKGHA